jgi:hypothetical protein
MVCFCFLVYDTGFKLDGAVVSRIGLYFGSENAPGKIKNGSPARAVAECIRSDISGAEGKPNGELGNAKEAGEAG